MYTTCMFCNKSLGENQVVETFPVGRRLAFDAERGRLWVVCKKCERWNLTPMEERWEAVEDLERLFRDTRVRVSTDNIGLARHAEGLEMVRVGRAMRPEFAAWRYGDQFGRRRRKALLYGAGGLAVFGGVVVGGAVTGVLSTAALAQGGHFYNLWMNNRPVVRVRIPEGKVLRLTRLDLRGTRIRATDDGAGYAIQVRNKKSKVWFEGEDATRTLGVLMPKINAGGGKPRTVQDAVSQIEGHGHPEHFLERIATGDRFRDKKGVPGYINKMETPTRLALEMALHEESERRALQGELWQLERAWQEAEEIAAIADGLLVPEGTEDFLERHREGEAGLGRPDPPAHPSLPR